MPNFINRQVVADSEYDVERWRKVVDGYNTRVSEYNAQVSDYNSRGTAGARTPKVIPNADGAWVPNKSGTTYQNGWEGTPDKTLLDNKPDEKDKPVSPSLTQQQMADLNKSDSPMTDAAMAESKRSPMNNLPGRSDGETGLISRALKGFK